MGTQHSHGTCIHVAHAGALQIPAKLLRARLGRVPLMLGGLLAFLTLPLNPTSKPPPNPVPHPDPTPNPNPNPKSSPQPLTPTPRPNQVRMVDTVGEDKSTNAQVEQSATVPQPFTPTPHPNPNPNPDH